MRGRSSGRSFQPGRWWVVLPLGVALATVVACTHGPVTAAATPGVSETPTAEAGWRPGSPGRYVTTRPQDGPERPPAAVLRLSGAPTSEPWYGHGDLWIKDFYPSYGHDDIIDGRYSLKLGWWTLNDGEFTEQALRLDAAGTAQVRLGPDGQHGWLGLHPGLIYFSAPGCWQVTGRLGSTTVQFVITVY